MKPDQNRTHLIRTYLAAQSTQALTDIIMETAERDETLFRALDIKAALAAEDGDVLRERLCTAIDSATYVDGFIDYYAASSFTEGVEEVIETIRNIATGPHAALAIDMAERILDGIDEAYQSIDDSDGELGGAGHAAAGVHLLACQTARPEPVALAQDLFERMMDEDYGFFGDIFTGYFDILGEAGQAEFRRLAAESWARLPGDASFSERYTPKSILDHFAELDGDVDARIALRSVDLSQPFDYLSLATFCRKQGREDDALRHAEEGLRAFGDGRGVDDLAHFIADILISQGQTKAAEDLLWTSFQRSPDLRTYDKLRALGGVAAMAGTIASLREKIKPDTARDPYGSSYASLLLAILTAEARYDEAWALVVRSSCGTSGTHALAQVTESTHAERVVPFYLEEIEREANTTNPQGYLNAAKLIGRLAEIQPPDAHAACLEDIKVRHKRKRNFMKLLVE